MTQDPVITIRVPIYSRPADCFFLSPGERAGITNERAARIQENVEKLGETRSNSRKYEQNMKNKYRPIRSAISENFAFLAEFLARAKRAVCHALPSSILHSTSPLVAAPSRFDLGGFIAVLACLVVLHSASAAVNGVHFVL